LLQPIIPKSTMKRIFLLLFAAILAFSSCENLEDNSPALQGEIDSIFFKSSDVRGQQNENGSFTLQGINQDEKLTLNLNRAQLGEYTLGAGHPSFATYEDPAGNIYTTAPLGEGQIVLTDRCLSCGWLTGTFRFTAVDPGVDTLNVQKGFFFEVSFLDGNIDSGPSVGTLTANVNEDPYQANSVTAEEIGSSIIINGFLNERVITIEVPANSISGNYILPITGFSASYTNNDETTEAISGIITVNFNNTDTRKILIFFNFDTGSDNITVGRTRVDY
jgi:Family of unknown function (DUF6252)